MAGAVVAPEEQPDGEAAPEARRLRARQAFAQRAGQLGYADFGWSLPAPAPPPKRRHATIDKLGRFGVAGREILMANEGLPGLGSDNDILGGGRSCKSSASSRQQLIERLDHFMR